MNGHLSFENSDKLQTMLNERCHLLGRQEWARFLKNNGLKNKGIGTRDPNPGQLNHWGGVVDGFVTMANPDGHRWLRVPMDFAMKALTLGCLPDHKGK